MRASACWTAGAARPTSRRASRSGRCLDRLVGDVRPLLWTLMVAVALVLVIATVNTALLVLSRAGPPGSASTRFAQRSGPGRHDLIRQLAVESLLLAALGGTAGVALAAWGLGGLLTLAPASFPRLDEVGLDATVLFFALMASLATSLACGWLSAGRLRQAGGRQALEGVARQQASTMPGRALPAPGAGWPRRSSP